MAVTIKWYAAAFISAFNKEIDFDSDVIKGALVTSSYVFDQDVHNYFDDVVAFEASGTGYTASGQAMSSPSVSYDGATNVFKLLCPTPLTWNPSTITARGLVVYDSSPATDATRPLIAYVDFGANRSSSASPFIVGFTDGVAAVNVA